jgi:hypothetical protein
MRSQNNVYIRGPSPDVDAMMTKRANSSRMNTIGMSHQSLCAPRADNSSPTTLKLLAIDLKKRFIVVPNPRKLRYVVGDS